MQRVPPDPGRDVERAGVAAVLRPAEAVRLRPLEVRQAAEIVPSCKQKIGNDVIAVIYFNQG